MIGGGRGWSRAARRCGAAPAGRRPLGRDQKASQGEEGVYSAEEGVAYLFVAERLPVLRLAHEF